jgi:hypothetical protein
MTSLATTIRRSRGLTPKTRRVVPQRNTPNPLLRKPKTRLRNSRRGEEGWLPTGVLPAEADDLRRLRDRGTQSAVMREVEDVVLSLTRTILGGTAPKKRVEGRTKRTYKSRNNHKARKRIMYARCQDLYRRRLQRRVEWAVGDQVEESLLDNQDERPSHAAFETFYTGVWGRSGQCNITMSPGA